MSITIAKENYPALPNETGTSGKREVIYLNYGASATAEAPKWIVLGGLKSHTFSISANVSTVQTKETGYWADGGVTSKTAELSADVIMKRDNEAQKAIEAAEKNALMFAIVDLDTKEYTKFWAVPSSWETTADGEDLISKSLSATIIGKPEQATGFKLTE